MNLKTIYSSARIDFIRVSDDGSVFIRDTGCGCCSQEEQYSVASALKEIDEEIARLQAARKELIGNNKPEEQI